MGASLKDIACKLNLSKTTVSWVLSGQGDKKGISAETQSRVLACARSLAYEPNLLARSLNTGVSKTIGLILPSISDTFFAHIADRIESEAEREGYSLMIAGSNSEPEREKALIRLFRSKKVDGIIIAPADASGREVGRLAESGCPVVLFDRCLAKTDAGCVVIDNEAGLEHISRGTLPHVDTMLLISDCSRRGVQAVGRIAEMIRELELNPGTMKLIINRAPNGQLNAGVKEEIEKYGLELIGVLPQDETVYEYDCDGKPSSQVPDNTPVKQALHQIMRDLNL